MLNKMELDYSGKEISATLKGSTIILNFESNLLPLKVEIGSDDALRLVDLILNECGEKNTEEMEDKILSLENRVEELEEQLELDKEIEWNIRHLGSDGIHSIGF